MLDKTVFAFLRLFPQFRELETIATLAASQAEAMESELNVARAQRDKADALRSEMIVEAESLRHDLHELRDSHEEIVREKLILEDRNQGLMDDRQRLWDVVETSLGSERSALRAQVNHAVQRAGGGIPYPDAHSLPKSVVPKAEPPGFAGRRGRMLGSQAAVLEASRFAMEELLPELQRQALAR